MKAAIIGLLFGGLGLGLYFKSVIDFLIPMLLYIASMAVVTVNTAGSAVGFSEPLRLQGVGGTTGRINRTHAAQPPITV